MQWYMLDKPEEVGLMAVKASIGLPESWAFTVGQPVSWTDEISFEAIPDSDGAGEDFLGNHLSLPIFSARLRALLAEAGVDQGIQYVPVRVFHSDGVELPGYAIANVPVVDALDLGRSRYTVYPDDYFLERRRGTIQMMLIPVLRPDRLSEYHVFRPKGFDVQIYCSERFREVVISNSLTGCEFHKVRQVGDPMP